MDVVFALPCGWFEVAKFSKPQIKRSSTSFYMSVIPPAQFSVVSLTVQRYVLFFKQQKKKSNVLKNTLLPYPSRIAKATGLVSFLFDTGFLTGEVAQVEDAGAAHGTVLVDINLLDERAGDGEDTLHTHAVGDLADSKGLGCSASAALKDNALEVLDSLFVTFFNLVMDGDGVASFELGELLALDKGLNELHYLIFSHDF